MFLKENDEDAEATEKTDVAFWKVLIVDDEPAVHTITKLVLKNFCFEEKKIQFLSAHSGAEAIQMMTEHTDIALIYLDVVMEEDDSGLQVVKHVRNVLNNHFVRIVLRTGQPGQAPAEKVIVEYDINDYKEKTNLDNLQMLTLTYASLRSYRDIMTIEDARRDIEKYRNGLVQVIESSADLFEIRSLQSFSLGLLNQLSSLLHLQENQLVVSVNGLTVEKAENKYSILVGTGTFKNVYEEQNFTAIPSAVKAVLLRAVEEQRSMYSDGEFVGYFHSQHGETNLIYISGLSELDALDKKLIDVFSSNVNIAFDNLYLDREITETQAEIICTLGDVVECRSKEAAHHVKRVAYYAQLLAQEYGLSEEECNTLRIVAPMHDIGKIAIPDRVLLKNGKLNQEEWKIMQTHARIGQDIFAESTRPILRAAAVVAGQHHEKYDGTGYPLGLRGEEIHIYGRIVALADVFDALLHKRCYKQPWPLNKVVALINSEAGQHFEPRLVEIFRDNIQRFVTIATEYPDS